MDAVVAPAVVDRVVDRVVDYVTTQTKQPKQPTGEGDQALNRHLLTRRRKARTWNWEGGGQEQGGLKGGSRGLMTNESI